MSSLHKRIKTSRIESGLSQSDLAEKAGVSQPTVANWESGSHIPRQSAMRRISQALGVDALWLLSGQHAAAKSPALDYLNAPIRHIPVYQWPSNFAEIDAGRPEGYLPGATHNAALFALISNGTVEPANALLLFDPDYDTPERGQTYLMETPDGLNTTPYNTSMDANKIIARLSAKLIQY